MDYYRLQLHSIRVCDSACDWSCWEASNFDIQWHWFSLQAPSLALVLRFYDFVNGRRLRGFICLSWWICRVVVSGSDGKPGILFVIVYRCLFLGLGGVEKLYQMLISYGAGVLRVPWSGRLCCPGCCESTRSHWHPATPSPTAQI